MLNGRAGGELHKSNSKIKVCADFSRFRAEMDALADVKHEISFNRPQQHFIGHRNCHSRSLNVALFGMWQACPSSSITIYLKLEGQA